VPYDNKIELQIAPPADAKRSAEARHKKSGVPELALAFTTHRPPRPRSNTLQLHARHLRLLIANDNPTRIVTRSDQRESKGPSFLLLKPARARILIANLELEFLPTHTKHSLLTFSNRKKIAVFDPHPSPPIGHPGDRHRNRSAIHRHVSNRNKNAHFAFPGSTSGTHELRVTSRDSRTTTRAAFRSTIPARPHAYR
jgi:hypothetical protein